MAWVIVPQAYIPGGEKRTLERKEKARRAPLLSLSNLQMPTTIKDAIKKFEETSGLQAAEAEKVELLGMCPPIEKMDGSLAVLKGCKCVPASLLARRQGPP